MFLQDVKLSSWICVKHVLRYLMLNIRLSFYKMITNSYNLWKYMLLLCIFLLQTLFYLTLTQAMTQFSSYIYIISKSCLLSIIYMIYLHIDISNTLYNKKWNYKQSYRKLCKYNIQVKVYLLLNLHNDVVDWDVYQLNKESDEPHNSKTYCCCHGNLLKF